MTVTVKEFIICTATDASIFNITYKQLVKLITNKSFGKINFKLACLQTRRVFPLKH